MSGGCVVWWAAPVEPDTAPGLVALLDDHEQERLQLFRRDADRARYVAAHALTRIVVGAQVGADAAAVEFDRTCRCGKQHGKPRLPDGPGFSLTHAGDLVGVAVHPGGEVGLDVEQVRPLTELASMTSHVCSPGETAPDPVSFFTLWTRKEALLKATGDGLSSPMSAITLDAAGLREWSGAGAPTEPVWLVDLAVPVGYRAAVAGLGVEPAVSVADGDAALRDAEVG